MTNQQQLVDIIGVLAGRGKGILAADESSGTITKRFKTINLESTESTRQQYRDLLLTAEGLNQYISGVILYDETLRQTTLTGVPFAKYLSDHGIIPGIKVDKGLIALPNTCEEQTTAGLDGLAERFEEYKQLGAQFAKWRVVFTITDKEPSDLAIHVNAHSLARYAAIAQAAGIVPIVEPEVLMDGSHDLARARCVTEKVLTKVFEELHAQRVCLEGMVLKPNMVVAGLDCAKQPSIDEVAQATVATLKRTTPSAVPMIAFLSGGQSDELATLHLNAMNKIKHLPWTLTFSYGRALQADALATWGGKPENVAKAQTALLKHAKANSLACLGEFRS